MDDTQGLRVQRRRDEPRDGSYYDGAGSLEVEWYFPASTSLSSHVMHYRLAPGAAEGEHLHQAGDPRSCSADSSDEIYVVTAGEVVVTSGGRRSVLRVGDAVYAPHGVIHGVVNESAEPAELVLIFGPVADRVKPQGPTGSDPSE